MAPTNTSEYEFNAENLISASQTALTPVCVHASVKWICAWMHDGGGAEQKGAEQKGTHGREVRAFIQKKKIYFLSMAAAERKQQNVLYLRR